MEKGTLPERYLSRSVIKHIRKHNKSIEVTAAVGNDYSRLQGIITADGMGDTPFVAWAKAYNNFACSGGVATGVRLTLMLPANTKESQIKSYMADFNSFALSYNIQILGGHSEVSEAFSYPRFLVTFVGQTQEYKPEKRKVKPGDSIVMTGYAGRMGGNIILKEHYDELRTRFSATYLNDAVMDEEEYLIYDVVNRILLNRDLEVLYMHDVSHGGVYGALWQLGVWMDKGMEINHTDIEIRQETIEICEFYDINPYMLDGTGSLLLITKDGEAAVDYLREQHIIAAVIGKVTQKKEKIVILNEIDKRSLAPVDGDERYRLNPSISLKDTSSEE